MTKALNSESEEKKEPMEEMKMLVKLREQQEKEQKALHLFGFVNKNKYNEVDEIEEDTKPVEKSRVKNKQHKNRADNNKFIVKQLKIWWNIDKNDNCIYIKGRKAPTR